MSLFCRHNRFTADCPICSKDLPGAAAPPRKATRATGTRKAPAKSTRTASAVRGPYSAAGPYDDDDGASYEVRLERVPGGVRLAEWSGDELRRRAPVLPAADLAALVAGAAEKGLLGEGELARIAGDGPGVSPGRTGELKDELRVDTLEDGRVRVGRWIYRPGTREWELQEAPPMLPAARYAEALAGLSGVTTT